MIVGIMQPYFLPYIGYFQLLNAVDLFVIYDDIEYTKKGWINRNRYLSNGHDKYLSLNLKKASDFSNINAREISEDFNAEKTLKQLESAYKKAPYFNDIYPLLQKIFSCTSSNLFEFIIFSIRTINTYLNINTEIVQSSRFIEHKQFKGTDKVLYICRKTEANHYVNAIGGTALYSKNTFSNEGIKLSFLQPGVLSYKQFENEFISHLSIVDVLMFNERNDVIRHINSNYTLI